MKTTVQLETKDIREIIAKFFQIRTDDVIPNRYSFSIANMSAEEIEKRIKDQEKWKKVPDSENLTKMGMRDPLLYETIILEGL